MITREHRAAKFRADCMAKLRGAAETYFHDCPLENEAPTEAGLRAALERESEDFGTDDNNLVKDMIGEVEAEFEGRFASCTPAHQ